MYSTEKISQSFLKYYELGKFEETEEDDVVWIEEGYDSDSTMMPHLVCSVDKENKTITSQIFDYEEDSKDFYFGEMGTHHEESWYFKK